MLKRLCAHKLEMQQCRKHWSHPHPTLHTQTLKFVEDSDVIEADRNMRTKLSNYKIHKYVEAVLIWLLTVTILTYSVPYSNLLSDHFYPISQCTCCLTDRLCSPISTQFNTTLTWPNTWSPDRRTRPKKISILPLYHLPCSSHLALPSDSSINRPWTRPRTDHRLDPDPDPARNNDGLRKWKEDQCYTSDQEQLQCLGFTDHGSHSQAATGGYGDRKWWWTINREE